MRISDWSSDVCSSDLWSVALAGTLPGDWALLLWLALGSVAMRGAGCVYNDIVDRDLDAQVARTRQRPVASGRVSVKKAWAWLITLCLVGLVVLLPLPLLAQAIALGSRSEEHTSELQSLMR